MGKVRVSCVHAHASMDISKDRQNKDKERNRKADKIMLRSRMDARFIMSRIKRNCFA